MTYGKWIMDEGTWSEFVPHADGKNQQKKRQAEHKIILNSSLFVLRSCRTCARDTRVVYSMIVEEEQIKY